ncbi:ice-binding family protein [Marinobacter changyiensis]|uniref:ice-binding family protein n=1 Tax=Marinobacter changyiensis TaxID=2604091 RepID=UPI00126442BC|nr:ice-binding family protein [Marinobacter changyiensis]
MNSIQKHTKSLIAIFIMVLVASISACGGGNSSNSSDNSSTTSTDSGLSVTATGPASDAVGVGTNSAVTATFSEAMNADTFNTTSFTVGADGEMPMPGTVKLDAATNTGIFQTSGGDFTASTEYTATITTAVKSVNGKALASNYEWSFTTGAGADIDPPTVTSRDPAPTDSGVAINRNISASFSEAMHVPSINSSTFKVTDANDKLVTGTVEVVGTTAIFDPANDLTVNATYTATLTTGVTDLAGNALAESSWKFTTGTSTAQGPAPVTLGTAGNYVILAKTAISTTGVTDITGDIALSPAAESFITGFSLVRDATGTFAKSSIVTGEIFAADMTAPTPSKLTTAISDMETAYTDAAGRSNPDTTELGAGNISGLTLEPGLYKWSSDLLIATDVVLEGSADDVWILQIAGKLTVSNDVTVNLVGGAMAKNVFWQVAGNTTFGTTSNVSGVFLSKTLIDIQTGATLNGQALAQTAVTLDANAVTEPAEPVQ